MIDAQELLRMDICDMLFELREKVPRTTEIFLEVRCSLNLALWLAQEELRRYKEGKQ